MTTQAIQNTLKQVQLADPIIHDGLCIHPLLSAAEQPNDYLTLDQALKNQSARITEISEGGSVPHLLFRNDGDLPVFLLDGEELVGARQNRILNISILAPGPGETIIPVSCVERGRWRHVSDEFKTASRAQFSESRAKRASQVSRSIHDFGEHYSDQGEVWSDISMKLQGMRSHSPTAAVEAAFMDHESRLGAYVDKLKPLPGQCGGIFSIRGHVLGLELFDRPETFQALVPKIVRSYALDAIDEGYLADEKELNGAPSAFLERVCAAPIFEAKAVGEGNDLRFKEASGLAGGALFARDRVVHLVAFAQAEKSSTYSGPAQRPFRRTR